MLDPVTILRSSLQCVLVGLGETGKNCGKIMPFMSCQCCHKVHFVLSRCHQKSCPKCWETWRKNQSGSIKSRIWERRNKKSNKFKRLLHMVLSPGKELVGSMDYLQLKKDAIDYLYSISHVYLYRREGKRSMKLKKYGFLWRKKYYTGPRKLWSDLDEDKKEEIRKSYRIINSAPSGVLIFHPFRLTKDAMQQYSLYVDLETNAGRKPLTKWDWIREQTNIENMIFYSPHFHFVGYMSWIEKQKKGDPWIYKVIEETTDKGKKVSQLDGPSLYRVVKYLLSHTGTLKDRPNVRSYVYTGNVSNSYGETETSIELEGSEGADGGSTVSDRIPQTSMEKKALKNKCRWCEKHGKQGKLWYIGQNTAAFFRSYGIPEDLDNSKKIIMVKNLGIPDYIVMHIIEIIRMRMGKPPPIDYGEYIIEGV